MEERKWENMNEDCLVNIFGRLDVESRLYDVPLVCKQWYRSTVNPLSWQTLVFPTSNYESRSADAFVSRLIKFVVGRSQGCATTIVLPDCLTTEDLIFVSDMCPSLKVLSVPYSVPNYETDDGCAISELLVKWKSLEVLKLDVTFYRRTHLIQIIRKISLNCNNFVELSITNGDIDQEVAEAIVSNLPTIKCLVLDESKVNLELILRKCKELELLYVRDCVGFDQDDEEILMIASRIQDFRCEGSRFEIDEDYFNMYYDDCALYSDY